MATNKIKCLIVDDEAAAHYVLINYIDRMERLEIVGRCQDALEAINFLHKNPVDLIFLDINMPELTGFDLLKTLSHPPKVILTTAYTEFALESYEYGAVDYLLKPIHFPRFLKAVERYMSTLPAEHTDPVPDVDGPFMVKADGNWIRIDPKEIHYTQRLGIYFKVFTAKQSHLISITTTELEQKLPAARFMRIHKSYIIAIDKISKYANHTVMIGATELPVGITYRRELADRMK
jgi:DNA-binding LytR/AlgR family response regulator